MFGENYYISCPIFSTLADVPNLQWKWPLNVNTRIKTEPIWVLTPQLCPVSCISAYGTMLFTANSHSFWETAKGLAQKRGFSRFGPLNPYKYFGTDPMPVVAPHFCCIWYRLTHGTMLFTANYHSFWETAKGLAQKRGFSRKFTKTIKTLILNPLITQRKCNRFSIAALISTAFFNDKHNKEACSV